MDGNFFLDVEQQTDRAVKIQYLGKYHWCPKSAFIAKKIDEMTVFGMKRWMVAKIMSKY